MEIKEAIKTLEDGAWWDSLPQDMSDADMNPLQDALDMAIAVLRAQQEAEENEPLTLDELREMARIGLAVWCLDSDGCNQVLLCMRKNWIDDRVAPHVWYIDEEGNAGVCSVKCMVELGARFYHHKPKEES